MFKSSLKIAWRHLLKHRQFTLLNLAGLAIGLAATILIFGWVATERNMDRSQNPRLYQVMQTFSQDDGSVFTTESTPDPLAPALATSFPGIADVAVVKYPDEDDAARGIITTGETSLKAREIYATPNFFSVFSYRLIEGNARQAFAPGSHILISDALAKKLFHASGDYVQLIGKTITWSRGPTAHWNGTFTITGVFAAPSASSSQQFDCIFPHSVYAAKPGHDIGWQSSNPTTYVLLKPGASADDFNSKIKNFIRDKFPAGSQDQKWAGWLYAQKYSDRYLYNHYENGLPAGGRIDYVRLFSVIAIFILVIACINFMNLSTAKAATRIKEVGIKKVVGAGQSTLVGQYLGEALLLTGRSLLLALVIVGLVRPLLETIIGKDIDLPLTPATVITLVGITLLTGVLAGSYPAFYLSRFRPSAVLKGNAGNASTGDGGPNTGALLIRKGLVVFQFVLAAIFIVGVLVVYGQLSLIRTRDLGFSRENVIHFANEGAIHASEQAFLAELRTIPGVVHASDVEGDLLGKHSGGGGINWPGKTQRVEFAGVYSDDEYMETMALKITQGRLFSRAFPTDTSGVVFNETAIAAMQLKDPIGKIVQLWGDKRRIIGVVKDFHYESLYKKIGPFFISFQRNNPNIIARLQTNAQQATLARIETLYKKYNPDLPFEYSFVSEDYQVLYASEQRLALLSRYFAGIAIVISCLGLFGLTAFAAQRRQKEIGIRKVVGATVSQLVVLLSRDFLQLIAIALLIAFPLAAWLMNRWLDNFAYRQHLSIGIFGLAAAILACITLVTISFQSIKAATTNPIHSLRTE